ncbi:hypothetical protein GCM10009560_31570 [Nonomuraea longicatena]|uniref:Uncharacterized protein n=1 Tax=Nonomuraea longicatena TaxID=83682 RepID=A0ABP3ZYW4_9ACTN
MVVTEIEWKLAVRRVRGVRVYEATCPCQPVVYELCAAGGLMFIRRSCEAGSRTQESSWERAATMEEIWGRLLASGRPPDHSARPSRAEEVSLLGWWEQVQTTSPNEREPVAVIRVFGGSGGQAA